MYKELNLDKKSCRYVWRTSKTF